MIPPTRLRDDSSAPRGVREALRAGQPSQPMPSDVRRRSAARIRGLVFVPAAASLLFWIKSAAIAALCVASAAVAVHMATGSSLVSPTTRDGVPTRPARRRLEQGRAQVAPQPVAMAPSALPEVVVPPAMPPESAHESAVPAPVQRSPSKLTVDAPAPPQDSLAIEAAVLEHARAMLEGSPLAALAALDGYAARFPRGQLAIEAELIAVDALRRLRRTSEARVRAAALFDRARGSLYEPRIRSMIAPSAAPVEESGPNP